MGRLRISALADDLAPGLRRAVEEARVLGLDGLELGWASGTLAEVEPTRSARRDLRRLFERTGLVLSALRADDLGGFEDPNANDRKIPEMARRIALGGELGAKVLTLRLGPLREGARAPAQSALAEAMKDLSREAERHGVVLAASGGEEPPERLAELVSGLSLPTVRAALDPAEAISRGRSAVEAAGRLGPLLAHCIAADARPGGERRPPGEGEVPWAEYLAALEASGYEGFHALDAGGRAEGIRDGLEFLRRLQPG